MATAAPGPRLYRSRRPELTLLYRALAGQFEQLHMGFAQQQPEPLAHSPPVETELYVSNA